MKRVLSSGTACVLAAVLFFSLPLPGVRAEDDSSLNKGALIGLFVVVVGVLFWLGFQSDLEDWSYAAADTAPCLDDEETDGFRVEPGEGEAPVLVLGSSPLTVSAEGIGWVF